MAAVFFVTGHIFTAFVYILCGVVLAPLGRLLGKVYSHPISAFSASGMALWGLFKVWEIWDVVPFFFKPTKLVPFLWHLVGEHLTWVVATFLQPVVVFALAKVSQGTAVSAAHIGLNPNWLPSLTDITSGSVFSDTQVRRVGWGVGGGVHPALYNVCAYMPV